ncbi:hypothetical protein HAX54_009523 [Datura stramonium]|uniref:malate synthase n=1 Tax=Datura stramonium TaxID=4076 RepID=A0ABS8RW78_DATST|nr:hypothetical protein [Datura stramonium]
MLLHVVKSMHNGFVESLKQAAQIPIRNEPTANEAVLELVKKEKLREVRAGHDGTWVAHPGLIPACMEVFTNNLDNTPNQIHCMKRQHAWVLIKEDLLQRPRGWLKYGVELDGDGLGVKVNLDLFGRVVEEEMTRIEREVGKEKLKKGVYKEASKLLTRQCTVPSFG